MDDFLGYFLLVIVIVAFVTLGYAIIHDLNLSGTAVATYTGEYCHQNGCDTGQEIRSGYLYPGEPLACPESIEVVKYVRLAQNDTYHIQEGSCQVISQ
ncbi:hypothetical protein A3K29_01565 [Candidatus Collierbacteria bacterium RIFOXYB2_FULL_46_14]|uniref:Uncharacterized protein n=1 Tax=Candidatus Collierbacteria bacterium GW2011_GWA2_46_26 TaxID=1618381 RepID=A0A0G1PJ50_9BACT|nr:MAG: hypothetical protein UW29_C0006G0053 [Candidatus Collierbacteria bacterium GW2011_GWC2_44_13]KKU32839.1 MAG: hypothetical protein UX47_C0007G0083 [Candidatus Collierbacteria bacterium GW2011_GWA2_46_26]OGD72818.1 MAG: hypothetical protein A3K29_01565 [Candidatus Collierbacteria bacterium RIFOXYB2_FULL_46_14]OGD75860.1 MAG: hypothetical protein A3K43_01565 [Candidatus Collierbacteria bacterium RIFOXYA2_FULL_46_20]OGD77196.1 MAG: hypothetical protein A3K39_01565 [Candidatus Collierbacteri